MALLDKYLFQFTMGALEAKQHPALNRSRCVNAKQGKTRCEKCSQVCPAHLLDKPEKGAVRWDACLDCGLCAVVCPAGALGLSAPRLKRALDLFAQDKPRRSLGCDKLESPLDYKGWCLGSLPWEMMAALALTGQVTLCRAQCEGCDRAQALTVLKDTLARLRAFLGDSLYEERVRLGEPGEAPPPAITRREAFGALFTGVRRTVSAAMPDESKLKNDGMLFRLLLVYRLEHLESLPLSEGCGWLSPTFTDACWACGICQKICPNQAISVVERQGARYLVHEPCLCTGCGACAAVCPDKAISAIQERRLPPGSRCVATRVESDNCSACGAPLRPGTADQLCLRCKARQKAAK